MQLTEHILTGNDCYRAGRTITPRGIMVYSAGAAQPDVEAFLRTWNRPGVDRCVHAVVHRGGAVETLPWNWRGWHAGAPAGGGVSADDTHIAIELLEPAGHPDRGGTAAGDGAAPSADEFAAVYRSAVELCAYLCRRYGLDPLEDIAAHDEGQWLPKYAKRLDTLRADVKRALEGGEPEMTQERFDAMLAQALARRQRAAEQQAVSEWAREAWDKAVAANLFDGTSPRAPLSREQAALLLDRMGIL